MRVELNDLNLAFPRALYRILFQAAWQTLQALGWNHQYLGAQLGATMVLHTWGSNLAYHPYVHCIVPVGGIALSGQWKTVKTTSKYLFPVKALSQIFRGKYINMLDAFMYASGMEIGNLKKELYNCKWVVYCKPPPLPKG